VNPKWQREQLDSESRPLSKKCSQRGHWIVTLGRSDRLDHWVQYLDLSLRTLVGCKPAASQKNLPTELLPDRRAQFAVVA
jgi:hypothetical protein